MTVPRCNLIILFWLLLLATTVSPLAAQPLHVPLDHADHAMAGSMSEVRQEHFWFSIVGFCVVVFKFLSDSRFPYTVLRLLWPACIPILGVLLVLYSE